MKHLALPTVVVAASLLGCQGGPTSTSEPRAAAATAAGKAGGAHVVPGLRYRPASSWTSTPSSSQMRVAEYRVPGAAAEQHASLIVYHFGRGGAGSADANLDRWCAQFEQPDGRDSREVAVTGQRDVNGMDVRTLDISGAYVAETFPGSGERLNKTAYRLLAAIIDTEAGPYYVKLVGPTATVDAARTDFETMLASLEPATVPARAALPPGHP